MATSTGKPGVCLATLGPAATNLVTGVTQAYLDRSPVIAISGQLPEDRLASAPHQSVRLLDLFSPVTKWVQRVLPVNAQEVVSRAISVATEERPGPVYLEVPSDVPRRQYTGDLLPRILSRTSTGEVDQNLLAEVLGAIREAKKPLVLAGLGVKRQDAHHELLALAEKLGVPVIVTPKAKGVVPEDHDLLVGTIEMLGTSYLYEMIQACDLVIAVGLDAVELDRPWSSQAPVIHIDVVPNLDHYFQSAWDLVGPMKRVLSMVESAVEPNGRWSWEPIRTYREELSQLVRPAMAGLCPHHVLDAMREVAPLDTILATDVGAHKMACGQYWEAYEPGRFLVSNGLSSMGYGLPAALAAN